MTSSTNLGTKAKKKRGRPVTTGKGKPRKAVPGAVMGRPTTFDETVCLEILDLIANHDMTLTAACRSKPHYPHASTFRDWAEKREDLARALERAQEHLAYQLIDATMETKDLQDKDLNRARFDNDRKVKYATTLLSKYAGMRNAGVRQPTTQNTQNNILVKNEAPKEPEMLRIPVGTFNDVELEAYRVLLEERARRAQEGLLIEGEVEESDDV